MFIQTAPKGAQNTPPLEAPMQILTPTEIWWCLLQGRLDEARSALPTGLAATIQFEVERDGDTAYFYLVIDGGDSYGQSGVAAEITTWVQTHENALQAMLDGGAADGTLKTTGNVEIFARVLDVLSSIPKSGSPLNIRLQR